MAYGDGDYGDPFDDPGFKQWTRGGGGRGAGIGRPGIGAAGGFGGSVPFGGAGIGADYSDPLAASRPMLRRILSARSGTGRPAEVPNMSALRVGAGAGRLTGTQPTGPLDGPQQTLGPPAAPGSAPSPGVLTPAQIAQLNRASGWQRGALLMRFMRENQSAATQGGTITPANWTQGTGPNGAPGTQDEWYQYMSSNNDAGWAGYLWRLLGAGGQAGAFDPRGSSAIDELISSTYNKRGAMEDAGDVNELSALGLDDPSLNAAMLMGKRGDRALTRDTAVAGARVDSAQRVQDLMRSIFGSYVGSNNQAWLNNWQQERANRGSGNPLGDLLGIGVSAFLPGGIPNPFRNRSRPAPVGGNSDSGWIFP